MSSYPPPEGFRPYEVWNALIESDIPRGPRAVMNAMAMRAGATGECWASVARIGLDIDMADKNVRIAQRHLVDLGCLVVMSAAIGSTTTYRFDISKIPRRSTSPSPSPHPGHYDRPTPVTTTGGSVATTDGGSVTTTGVDASPRSLRPGGVGHYDRGGRSLRPGGSVTTTDNTILDSIPDSIPEPILSATRGGGSPPTVDQLAVVQPTNAGPTSIDVVSHLLPGDRLPAHVSNSELINHAMDLAETVGVRLRPVDQKAVRASGLEPTDLTLLWAWAQTSTDNEAILARESGWSKAWKSLLNANADHRMALARAWDARGRASPPRSGGGRASTAGGHIEQILQMSAARRANGDE